MRSYSPLSAAPRGNTYARKRGPREMPSPAVIEARDIDPVCIRRAEANARRAGVADMIRFSVGDITASDLSAFRGVIVTNPPYGERLGNAEAAHMHLPRHEPRTGHA